MNKIPINSPHLESAVLAALMTDRSAAAMVGDILTPKTFYGPKNELIWESIQKILSENKTPDMLSVVAELKVSGNLQRAGGMAYISEVAGAYPDVPNVESHAHHLRNCEIKRNLFAYGNELMKLGINEEIHSMDCIDEMMQGAYKIAYMGGLTKPKSTRDLLKEIQETMSFARKTQGITGIPSGIAIVDEMFKGWQAPDLIIIAGRPAMGKTGFALTIADNACLDYGKKCLFFSMEMSAKQLTARRISRRSGISSNRILSDKLNVDEQVRVGNAIGDLLKSENLIIDDSGGLTITELSVKARRAKLEQNIDFIVVDYLQLLSDSIGGNREQEISSISRKLKSLAKTLGIPVIALSQLSRAPETRGGESRPRLSDLRESGAIEQDADIVIFPYRPEYYNVQTDGVIDTKGIAILIVAKHRNGSTGELVTRFHKTTASFSDAETQFSELLPDEMPF